LSEAEFVFFRHATKKEHTPYIFSLFFNIKIDYFQLNEGHINKYC